MNGSFQLPRFFADLSVRRKLIVLTALVAIGIVALAVVAARIQYLDLYETRKAALKAQVELTIGVLEQYHALETSGGMDTAAAQKAALKAIASMRASGHAEPFYIHDTAPVMLMHSADRWAGTSARYAARTAWPSTARASRRHATATASPLSNGHDRRTGAR